MLSLLQQCQYFILTLLQITTKHFQESHSQYTYTASWADASHPLILGWGGGY